MPGSRAVLFSTLVLLPFLCTSSFAAESELLSFSGDLQLSLDHVHPGDSEFYAGRLRLEPAFQLMENLAIRSRIDLVHYFDSGPADDNDFLVEQLYFDWQKIGGMPVNLAAGRLATYENRPAQFRLGLDEVDGELSPFTSLFLDGVRAGVDYDFWNGGVRLYYAKMVDEGYEAKENDYPLRDSTFYGIGVRLYEDEAHRLDLHSLMVKDVYNLPQDTVFINPLELVTIQLLEASGNPYDTSLPSQNGILDQQNLGDIYVTTLVAEAQTQRLNYFAALGWSHTDAKAIDELGTGLLSSWWEEPTDRDGYSVYVGGQYKLPEINSLLGLEGNYGSKYWLSLDQDGENTKLATRGKALEIYWIYAPPVFDPISGAIDKQLIRLGYYHLWYDYTYSGSYLGEPMNLDEIADDPLASQFYSPETTAYTFYLNYQLFF